MKTAFEAGGDVRTVDLLAAVVSIWREGRSGSVRFTRSTSSAGFDFSDGELVAAFSSDPRFETAAILVRAGKLDGGALERLTVPAGTDAALAALQAGILTRREWKWGEKIRSIEILAELLGWPDGKYLFDADARPASGDFSLPVPRLVLELFLRSRDHHLVDHQLGPVDVPLVRSATFEQEFATFGLTADAESVVHLIDGRASASEICERAPAEEFAVRKLLAALTTLGLLEHRGTEEAAAEPAFSPASRLDTAPETESLETEPEPLLEVNDREPPREETKAAGPVSLAEDLVSGAIAEPPESGETGDPGLDVEVGEVAPAWGGAPAQREWESPSDELDRELDTTIEPSALVDRRRQWGKLLWLVPGLLVVAVGATVLLRGRSSSTQAPRTLTPPPSPARATHPPTTLPAMAAPSPAASPVSSRGPTISTMRLPPPAATPRPAKAAPMRAAPGGHPEAGRSEWLSRAQADRRKLDADRRIRYAIQLELACEVPSLTEAWKHDRPSGSMWLLKVSHGGRDCFRVLWGRFPSVEAARKAKSGIPAFFTTATNHPAVVAVR